MGLARWMVVRWAAGWAGLCFLLPSVAAAAPPAVERLRDGVALALGERRLEVRVCRDEIVRVLYAPPGPFFSRSSMVTVPGACSPTPFEVETVGAWTAVKTRRLTARISLPGGEVSFLDSAGRTLLAAKKGGGLRLDPAEVMGEATHHVQAEFEPATGEALYGLGAHQHGFMDYAGRDVDLFQLNTVDVVPFLASSRGYGVLWDNTSHTKFGDLKPAVHVPAGRLLDPAGRPGGLLGTYRQGDCATGKVVATRQDPQVAFGAPEDRPGVTAIHQAAQARNAEVHPALGPGPTCVVFEGWLESEAAGEYDLMTFASNGVRLWLDGALRLDTWRQAWLPWWDSVRVRFGAAERHALKLEWRREDDEATLRLKWKAPPRSPYLSLWSEVGDGIDYYVVHGPDLDDVVSGYRELTGRAPLMPRFALGLWQSRERYKTAQESLDVLSEFRRRRIPVDTLVQDWQYWRGDQWGSHEFDPERFPDPAAWVRAIHAQGARLMISVWPKFYTTTGNFKALNERGFLYPETLKRPTTDWLGHAHSFYDAFNPEARRLFWAQVKDALFSRGVDAWWMDATEPELVGEGTPQALKAAMHPTALGSGARLANAYVLPSSQAIYEGQRAADPRKRVFILTRSAFAGVQRYASAVWSGDIASDWDVLRKQVPAGLNMTLSGVPWWTTDVGGFAVPRRFSAASPKPEDREEWRELVTRWFQFATFSPLLRVHGQFPHREMWFFGADEGHRAFTTQLAFNRLRYRLLPYAYTLAAEVTRRHGSLMRPLVMDFAEDPEVLGIGDQFLFGPSLLVNPVTRPGATSRPVYLPRGRGFYDFWTGAFEAGGRRLEAPAPYESLPLYVKAGSILPLGPELQHTGEKPADPLTLWVYTGEDAAFDLYEDDGETYGYEQGAHATLPLRWDERSATLHLGERKGEFPGMLRAREVRVVFVTPRSPVPHSASPAGARVLRYDGRPQSVRAPAP